MSGYCFAPFHELKVYLNREKEHSQRILKYASSGSYILNCVKICSDCVLIDGITAVRKKQALALTPGVWSFPVSSVYI